MRAALLIALVGCFGDRTDMPMQGSPDATISDAPPNVARPTIPQPTGTCPTIGNGDVMFAPAGIPPRKVKLALGSVQQGPLILYWHATGSAVAEAAYALGSTHEKI